MRLSPAGTLTGAYSLLSEWRITARAGGLRNLWIGGRRTLLRLRERSTTIGLATLGVLLISTRRRDDGEMIR